MAETKDMDNVDFFDDSEAEVVDTEATEITDANPLEETAVEEVKSESSETAVATSSGLSGIGIDFSSLAATLPGVAVGNTGLTVTRFPVERIKFSKSQKTMISILSDQVIAVKTHYDEVHGNFLCFGGACCDSDLARVRYVFPIVRYATDTKGKPIANIGADGKPQTPLYDLQNMCLSVGQETYDTLVTMQELKGSLTNLDLLVSCSDEQYQKISIQEATTGGDARYKKDKNLVKEVEEFWKQNGKNILKSVAKKITPEDYAKDKAADMAAGTEVDFDDIFGE